MDSKSAPQPTTKSPRTPVQAAEHGHSDDSFHAVASVVQNLSAASIDDISQAIQRRLYRNYSKSFTALRETRSMVSDIRSIADNRKSQTLMNLVTRDGDHDVVMTKLEHIRIGLYAVACAFQDCDYVSENGNLKMVDAQHGIGIRHDYLLATTRQLSGMYPASEQDMLRFRLMSAEIIMSIHDGFTTDDIFCAITAKSSDHDGSYAAIHALRGIMSIGATCSKRIDDAERANVKQEPLRALDKPQHDDAERLRALSDATIISALKVMSIPIASNIVDAIDNIKNAERGVLDAWANEDAHVALHNHVVSVNDTVQRISAAHENDNNKVYQANLVMRRGDHVSLPEAISCLRKRSSRSGIDPHDMSIIGDFAVQTAKRINDMEKEIIALRQSDAHKNMLIKSLLQAHKQQTAARSHPRQA